MKSLLAGVALVTLTSALALAGSGTSNLATHYPHGPTSASGNLSTSYPHGPASASVNLSTSYPHAPTSASGNLATSYPHTAVHASGNLATSYPAQGGGSGGSIACDYGPPYTGPIPDAAQAAGFTHCAANMDFSDTSNFTFNGATENFGNMATWFDCFSGSQSTALLFHPPVASISCDNNHYNMVTDAGNQVFQATWNPSDGGNTIQDQTMQFIGAGPAYNGYTVPLGFYHEVTWRVDNANICPGASNGCLEYGPFTYIVNGYGPNPYMELDFEEMYTVNTNGTGFIGTGWLQAYPTAYGPPPAHLPYDPTHYNTYGFRMTSDGSSTLGLCVYYAAGIVRGIPGSGQYDCQTFNPSGDVYSQRSLVTYDWGPNPNDVSNITAGFNLYVMRDVIWSCPGWQGPNEHDNPYHGAECNGPINPTP